MEKILPAGFNLYREHFMFGRCDGYINEKGEFLFKLIGFAPDVNGKYLTGQELYDVLKDRWVPAGWDERRYAETHLVEFQLLPAPGTMRGYGKEELKI